MHQLSDQQLISALDKLITTECALTVTIIAHLAEVEERKLHLAEGYSSMFQFLQEKYHYSESAAWRRLSAARALRQFPQIRNFMESQAINLSTLSLIAKALTPENCDELLRAASGKSQREVEKMLIERGNAAPGVRAIPKEKLCKEKVEVVLVETNGTGKEVKSTDVDAPMLALFSGAPSLTTSAQGRSEEVQEVQQVAYRIEFYADVELQSKMQTVRTMLSSTYPTGATIAQMLNVLADSYLKQGKRAMPETAAEVVSEVQPRAETAPVKTIENISPSEERPADRDTVVVPRPATSGRRTRYIPKAVRENVRARDRGRCTFVGANGKRCDCTWDLEYEHVVPFARGGCNDEANLTLLCRAHNHYRAEQTFGREFIRKKTCEARTSAAEVEEALDNIKPKESTEDATQNYFESPRETQRVCLRT